ncbi:MAG: hypothetical protein ACRDQD_01090 [Nocardioidaceae bacterium]
MTTPTEVGTSTRVAVVHTYDGDNRPNLADPDSDTPARLHRVTASVAVPLDRGRVSVEGRARNDAGAEIVVHEMELDMDLPPELADELWAALETQAAVTIRDEVRR